MTTHHAEKEKWLSSRDRIEGAQLRLICLPHAGSGATSYQSWRREMPSFVELCAVKLPGRETRLSEPSFTDSQELVEKMTEVLADECDIPYAIFGHSMGAVLAYEFAQSLQRRGLPPPVCLFVSGRVAAHLKLPARPVHALPLQSFLSELEVRYGGLPRELLQDQEMLDFYLPILRSDLQLIETYQYKSKPPLKCSVVVSGGIEDKSIWLEGLEAWRQHTVGGFTLHRYDGGHFYLSGESKAPLLAMVREQLIALHARAAVNI
jgi:surfactin synthase thioesterase subunit